MAKKHFTRPAYPATRRVTVAGAAIGDFVKVGQIKGFALEATHTTGDFNGTALIGFGEVEGVTLVAGGALGGIAEGDPLLWDAALDGGAGAFTDTGADANTFDAIAGYGVSLAAGATGTGEVLVPAPY